MLLNKPVKMCTRRSCCPTIEYANNMGMYLIKDDYGGKVVLLKEEIEKMWEIVNTSDTSEVQDEKQNSST